MHILISKKATIQIKMHRHFFLILLLFLEERTDIKVKIGQYREAFDEIKVM